MSKFKPGDLVLVRVHAGMRQTFNGKIGTIRHDGHDGHDDFDPRMDHVTHNREYVSFVEFAHPFLATYGGKAIIVAGAWLGNPILIKLSDPDVNDETTDTREVATT